MKLTDASNEVPSHILDRRAKVKAKTAARDDFERMERAARERFHYHHSRAPRDYTGRSRAANDIVAVDGEGITDAKGRHLYTMLAASTGARIENAKGLPTEDCLRFLLDLKGKLVFSFAFNYDVNKIVNDLRSGHLRKLHDDGYCYWKGKLATYRLMYIARKSFVVSERNEDKKTVRSVTVWDTFGFFQTSFVKTLKAWLVGTADETTLLHDMKEQRSDFSNVRVDDIATYNDIECRLLVDLGVKLRATWEAAGYKLTRWDGAGAGSSAMLRRYGVKKHSSLSYPNEVMNAYFGGRIQVCQIGDIPGTIYNYDVNSCYPAEAAKLPSLAGAVWHWRNEYTGAKWALWRVRWRLQERQQCQSEAHDAGDTHYLRSGAGPSPVLTPFPFRDSGKSIHYPIIGEGWYWSPLVDVAVKHFPGIEVLGGWEIEPVDDSRPFGFIEDAYARRLVYKRESDPRHIVIKLALNAMYGKLAQGIGWRGAIPPYRNYVWAGLITAGSQAKLLSAALREPDSVIAFATDGLYSRRPLDIPVSTNLGEWELNTYDRMLVFQPGLYTVYKDGKEIMKTRGYFPKELRWDLMLAKWKELLWFAEFKFTVSRFLGFGQAMHMKRLADWGRWNDEPRHIRLRPSNGFPGFQTGAYAYRWEPSYNVRGLAVSAPYTPRDGINPDIENERFMKMNEDQPQWL